MVLCIIPPHFKLIAEILKELERERRLGRTDGRTQWPTIIPVGPMAADGKKYYKPGTYRSGYYTIIFLKSPNDTTDLQLFGSSSIFLLHSF